MSRYLGHVGALARKDLLLELRARETLPAMVLFVLATFVTFHFALPANAGTRAPAGLLWVALVFTLLVGLARSFAPEREQRTLEALLLAPCDRSAIWLAKSLAALAFLAAVEVVALPAQQLFFGGLSAQALAAVALADIGLCALGALVAAMASAGSARELVLPLVFLPLALPAVAAGVGATVVAHPGRFLAFLGLYDAVFAILCWAFFEYVVTE
ncbi:MAG: heme exporter protein CcmB [Gaiellaceae bacterium]